MDKGAEFDREADRRDGRIRATDLKVQGLAIESCGMRLADRLFAFRRPPEWTDAVQVLLWLLGWAVLVGGAVFLVAAYIPMAWAMVRFGTGLGPTMWLALAFSFLVVFGWGLVGSWFVSEAYGGWRVGHRHGRQWALVIAVLMLASAVWAIVMRFSLRSEPLPDMGAGTASLLACEAAFGLALLVATLTTKPPSAEVPPPSPPSAPPLA